MVYFCPKCKRLAEFDPYHDRFYCTSCTWRSKKENLQYIKNNLDKAIEEAFRKYL
jgi:Zn-finger protein